MSDVLIRNAAAILTGRRGDGARASGPDIRIRDGRIAAIGGLAPEAGEATVDATDCVVYPAWVNTHHHLFQSLLKGEPRGLNATLTAWLAATPYRFLAPSTSDFTTERLSFNERASAMCRSTSRASTNMTRPW